MIKLVSVPYKIKIKMPKTYFFIKGKPRIVIDTKFEQDKEGHLSGYHLNFSKEIKHLKVQSINKDFMLEMARRKKEELAKTEIRLPSSNRSETQNVIIQPKDAWDGKECGLIRYDDETFDLKSSN